MHIHSYLPPCGWESTAWIAPAYVLWWGMLWGGNWDPPAVWVCHREEGLLQWVLPLGCCSYLSVYLYIMKYWLLIMKYRSAHMPSSKDCGIQPSCKLPPRQPIGIGGFLPRCPLTKHSFSPGFYFSVLTANCPQAPGLVSDGDSFGAHMDPAVADAVHDFSLKIAYRPWSFRLPTTCFWLIAL